MTIQEAIKWECSEDVLEKCVESCMTYKDAIKHIDSIRVNDPDLRIALDIAIEALGKQIPNKPVGEWFSCPNCGISQNYMRANRWCSDCGQRIDWSEET